MLSNEQTWRANQMTKFGAAVARWGARCDSGTYWNLCNYLWDFNTVGESKSYRPKPRRTCATTLLLAVQAGN